MIKKEVKPPPKKLEKKPAPPKDDLELKKRMQEQLAMEQKALDQQRQERQLRELLAAQKADAARKASAARASALGEYIAHIQAKVRGNWILPPDLQGNPEAVFLVTQLPTGEVLSSSSSSQAVTRPTTRRSSGRFSSPRRCRYPPTGAFSTAS